MKNKQKMTRYMMPYLAGCFLLGLVVSCDSFVDVAQPNSQLTSAAVFTDYNTASAAMKDVFAKMRDVGLMTGRPVGLSHLAGVYTDELVSYQTSATSAYPFYSNALTATHSYVQDLWNSAYSQIYAANAVLEGVSHSSVLTQVQKNQLTGEALFARALLHSYLVGVYGACPYITTTDYQQNVSVSRLPKAQVYGLCISDLEEAADLLPENYIGSMRSRPNKFAAKALLARLYLYNGQWAEASNEASAVINQTGLYVWEADLNKVFLKACTGTIWQFSPAGTTGNTQEGALFVFNAGPPPVVALSPDLYNAFETGDLRRTSWIRTITSGVNTWHHAYKYKQGSGNVATTEHSIVLRLAEQYLIRAEARARQGELSNAKQDLDFIRANAGLAGTTAVTQAEIIEAVIKERRVELFTEFGHRFFDLQRTGKLDAVLTPVKVGWNSDDSLWPVPQSELLINPNLLPQNAGY
ncbi:RagB/SusD family nutrient uptake outer membrane protein [Flavobacterium sedimenticola]|uniref:RagB/SusD family nutrient uptake outer membrane protein n=1 Tax=Flavobacterium sedimenticola TaxID=3043286 RepID=A0ABT6XS80_9FLAO|nr:RagB/SusD family nutrient uptake outer membrane protein [Flavobacterium sedimenticola]MDI9257954.1 RagB/SusD family nutrient uptake outer membrane protein [Flavobacterium sedimenticola]